MWVKILLLPLKLIKIMSMFRDNKISVKLLFLIIWNMYLQ